MLATRQRDAQKIVINKIMAQYERTHPTLHSQDETIMELFEIARNIYIATNEEEFQAVIKKL